MKKNENTLFFKIIFGFFAFFLLFVPKTALAATQIEVGVSGANGTFDLSDAAFFFPNTGEDCAVQFYSGTYPSGTPLYGGHGPYDCSDAYATPDSVSPFAYITMQGYISANAGGTAPDGQYYFIDTPDGSTDEIYFIVEKISGNWAPVSPDPTDGVTPDFPLTGDESGTPVLFTGTYNNGATFDQIVFSVNDVTDSNQQEYILNLPLINGVGLTYSKSIPLTTNHSYEYQVWLRDSSNGDTSDVSDFEAFDTTDGVIGTPPISPETCPDGTIENAFSIGCHLRNFAIWMFVPDASVLNAFSDLKNTFATSFPFSYIYDFVDMFNDSAGTPETLPTVAIETGFGSSIEIVSQSSIESVIPSGVADFFKGLITMGLYLGLVLYVYRKIQAIEPRT